MNKEEFVQAIVAKTDLIHARAGAYLNVMLDIATKALTDGAPYSVYRF